MTNETARTPEDFQLEQYLTEGVEGVLKDVLKASLSDPKETLFMARFAAAARKATKKRDQAEKNGEHIPPFLIASITSRCNLHCTGCYARAGGDCSDDAASGQLTDKAWQRIFAESDELGISFVLLAGGEPMMRPDILQAAGTVPNILFPVFTNGTLINERSISLFDKHRNLVPVLSIEGGRDTTDRRRGAGTHDKLQEAMDCLTKHGLLFGASVTVTTENMADVTGDAFLRELERAGCRAVIYVGYVPVDEQTFELAPDEEERLELDDMLFVLRERYPKMLFISFPGDEKRSGGCLAAGRGFFHINSRGGAEPCPFSPYSDTSVTELGVRGALNSPLFVRLRAGDILLEDHAGGCVLFESRDKVQSLLHNS